MAADAVAADAVALLRFGCERLEEQGCTRVLAPMDGSTWGAYRCRLQEPLGFAGEPAWGPAWAPILTAAGFHTQTRYLSSLCGDLEFRREAPRARRRLASLRLRGGAAAAGLAESLEPQLHRLVLRAFAAQPWFRPLPAAAFAALLRARLGADPCAAHLLAWAEGEPVGLLLGGRAGDQLVVRTLAVLPERRFAGLGSLLLEEAHQLARAAGCRSAIHALMLEGGPSELLSHHYAHPVAGYALMARSLG
ncbi:MAG: GNAT family N-acetyltransferase [Cyanobium sp.]